MTNRKNTIESREEYFIFLPTKLTTQFTQSDLYSITYASLSEIYAFNQSLRVVLIPELDGIHTSLLPHALFKDLSYAVLFKDKKVFRDLLIKTKAIYSEKLYFNFIQMFWYLTKRQADKHKILHSLLLENRYANFFTPENLTV